MCLYYIWYTYRHGMFPTPTLPVYIVNVRRQEGISVQVLRSELNRADVLSPYIGLQNDFRTTLNDLIFIFISDYIFQILDSFRFFHFTSPVPPLRWPHTLGLGAH